MASRTFRLPDLISASGWRLLLAACVLAALTQAVARDHYASALVLGVALALTLFDLWRVMRPRSATDLTARGDGIDTARRLEQALALLDAVTIALFVLDAHGRVRFANQAGRTLAGFEVARLQDIPLLGETGAASILSLPTGARQLVSLADGRSMLVWVGSMSAPGSGLQRLVSMQAVVGELDAVQVGAWHMMTRVLAHEMMNSLTPIASISESLSRLVKETKVPPEIAAAVATIARRGNHLMRFVERYRAIVDLPMPELADVDVRAFLADIDHLIGAELRDRGIDFAMDPVEHDWHVAADHGLLEQAVLNLVKNASEAVAGCTEARIRVSCKCAHGLFTITVSDNGVGVTEDQLEDIFIPFFTTRQAGRASASLSLARSLLPMAVDWPLGGSAMMG